MCYLFIFSETRQDYFCKFIKKKFVEPGKEWKEVGLTGLFQDSIMSGSVEIPLRESDEVIEIPFSDLPEGEEVLGILNQEKASLHLWVSLAVEYYRQGKVTDFVDILEQSLRNADINYDGYDR